MSEQEVRNSIRGLLNENPQAVIEEVLGYIHKQKSNPSSSYERRELLNQILKEDQELLKKLAQ